MRYSASSEFQEQYWTSIFCSLRIANYYVKSALLFRKSKAGSPVNLVWVKQKPVRIGLPSKVWKDVSYFSKVIPTISFRDVVDVCHLILKRFDFAKVFLFNKGLKLREPLSKQLDDFFVTRVLVLGSDFLPVM